VTSDFDQPPQRYEVRLARRAVRSLADLQRRDQQRMRAAWAKHSIEIDTDHSPFFSAPQATADFILETHREETK
jgi:hypothetical protein